MANEKQGGASNSTNSDLESIEYTFMELPVVPLHSQSFPLYVESGPEEKKKIGTSLRTAAIGFLAGLTVAAGIYFKDKPSTSHSSNKSTVSYLKKNTKALASEIAAYGYGYDIQPDTVLGGGLRPMPSTPVKDGKVKEGQKKRLIGATFALVSRPKGGEEPWSTECSTVKISTDKRPPKGFAYMLSAMHCISPKVNLKRGSADTALNEVNIDREDYAVAQPLTVKDPKALHVVGTVKGISAIIHGHPKDAREPDIVLLKVKYPQPPNTILKKAPSEILPNNHKPVPGEEVFDVNATSGVDNDLEVTGSGIYLGEYEGYDANDNFSRLRTMINTVRDARRNPLEPGSSGGLAITPSGVVGIVSDGIDNPYELHLPSSQMQSDDYFNRLVEEQSLGINLSPRAVVEDETVPNRYIINTLIEGLKRIAYIEH
jgi:hypothetical protein